MQWVAIVTVAEPARFFVSSIEGPYHRGCRQFGLATDGSSKPQMDPDQPSCLPVSICWQVDVCDVVVLAAVAADASPAALLHQHLMPQ